MRENLIFEAYTSAEYGCTRCNQYQVSSMGNRPKFFIHKNSNSINRQKNQHDLALSQRGMTFLLLSSIEFQVSLRGQVGIFVYHDRQGVAFSS